MSFGKGRIIYQLYSDADVIYENGDNFTVKDKNGKDISIDMAAVDAEYAKQNYKNVREPLYPSIQDQLDMQYWDSVNGTTTWKDAIAKVKTDNPKPS